MDVPHQITPKDARPNNLNKVEAVLHTYKFYLCLDEICYLVLEKKLLKQKVDEV